MLLERGVRAFLVCIITKPFIIGKILNYDKVNGKIYMRTKDGHEQWWYFNPKMKYNKSDLRIQTIEG